ncbi:MAG: DivIVA domain-containing protein [Coriobacteriia bacterium]|nr:DivIVA domain-containing protein [Coriobacteriia bacterium]
MKLTPLDIHHKEFGHSLRGYNEEQVDGFLDEVADELERLFKENIDLSERLDTASAKVNEYEMQRHTINNTLMAAQRSADEIQAKARVDADAVLRDADSKAKEIIHNALSKKQLVANELVRIKQAEEEFRARYRALLESNLREVSEIPLPSDIDVLLGQTDEGVIGDVAVREAVAPTMQPAPVVSQPIAVEAPAPAESVDPVASAPVPDPPRPGFVQSVTLGEIGEPDVPDDLSFVDPGEFKMPSFDALGEREDDLDIEEID